MDDTDDLLRWALILSGLGGVLAIILGGLFTRVKGAWSDGTRKVVLHQLGPLVWGEAVWPGGRQGYRGRATFGRVKLTRLDFGAEHLKSLGFEDDHIPLLEGQITGHFRLRLHGNEMQGRFFGRKFSFETNKIRQVSVVAPVQRSWQRYTGTDNED